MASNAQRQWVVTIAGISGFWMTKSGGEITSDMSKLFPGGTKDPEIIASPAQTANVVLSRPYDVNRDEPMIKDLRTKVGVATMTINVQATDRDLVAVGSPTVYAGAVLVRIGEPAYDANSGEPSVVELEFAVLNPA